MVAFEETHASMAKATSLQSDATAADAFLALLKERIAPHAHQPEEARGTGGGNKDKVTTIQRLWDEAVADEIGGESTVSMDRVGSFQSSAHSSLRKFKRCSHSELQAGVLVLSPTKALPSS